MSESSAPKFPGFACRPLVLSREEAEARFAQDGDPRWLPIDLNPHLVRNGGSARKKQKISRRVRHQVFERDGFRCRLCSTHLDLSVDHIIPESKGGTLDFDNLQTLCLSCNRRKGARV